MKRSGIIIEIDRVCGIIAEADSAYDELARIVGCDPESRLWTAMATMQSALIDQTERLIGDQYKWLSWYIWENDCGKKGYEAGDANKMRPIRSSADLARMIAEQ
jgi:hypothetical protein